LKGKKRGNLRGDVTIPPSNRKTLQTTNQKDRKKNVGGGEEKKFGKWA